MFLFKYRSHSDYMYGNSKSSCCRLRLKVLNMNFMCWGQVVLNQDFKSIHFFLSMLGFERRASPLYFPPFYCLQSPFPAASMHQFYCRAQRWSEPRREVAAVRGRGADEDGVKCLCMCRHNARELSERQPKRHLR